MHLHKRIWGNVIAAAALVTFALPLATPLATPAGAQAVPGNSVAGVGTARPAVAFNPIGIAHTVTFTCENTTAGTSAAGCYDVTTSLQDVVSGSAVNVNQGTCGTAAAISSGTNLTCVGTTGDPLAQAVTTCTGIMIKTVSPPVMPFTYNMATGFCEAPTSATDTTTATTISENDCTLAAGSNGAGGAISSSGTVCQVAPTAAQATATINPGAPHDYLITFSGYIPLPSGATTCPAGTGATNPPGAPVTLTDFPEGGSFCAFQVTAEKKYFEVTTITLTPSSNCTGGTLTFAEGLKSFFGPSCTVTASVTGTTILKTDVNCANEPVSGTSATSAGFPAGSTYQCSGGTLSVVGITPTSPTPVTFNVSGAGSGLCTNTLGGLSSGGAGGSATAGTTGVPFTFCPTGPGAASVQACLGTSAAPLPNNQPSICSNTVSVTFTVNASRVVPYVRWAGEKIVLTKCFGVGLAGSTVEFTLQGNNDGLNATLIPAALNVTQPNTGGATGGSSGVFVTADGRGCATVIGFASGEGVMDVDAAVYAAVPISTTPNGTTSTNNQSYGSLINEHAFQVFYLKFERVSLENVTFATYTVAQAISPYLSFLAAAGPSPTGQDNPFSSPLNGASAAALLPTSFQLPGAPGTGEVASAGSGFAVPLCNTQYVRAMVHGYFEFPGDPSGRPVSNVTIPGAASGSAGSYTLPAGRWVLPEDWPLLATFAGFGLSGQPNDFTPSSVLAWDLNSGYVFNPGSERPVICGNGSQSTSPGPILIDPNVNGTGPNVVEPGPISDFVGAGSGTNLACFGEDGSGTTYATAPNGPCTGGTTFAPFDATEACTNPFPLTYSPAGSSVVSAVAGANGGTNFNIGPASPNSTYLPNGTLNEWDAPMPPAQVSFGITSGVGFLSQVNKTGLYFIHFAVPAVGGACTAPYILNSALATPDCEIQLFPDPFYSEAIPASPLIPPLNNNGGYLWNTWGFNFGTVTTVANTIGPGATTAGGYVPGESTGTTTLRGGENLRPISTCGTGMTTAALPVENGAGFLPGMTLEAYYNGNAPATDQGKTILTGILITAVNGNVLTLDCTSLNQAFANSPFNTNGMNNLTTVLPFQANFISEQFGLPVSNASTFTANQDVTVISGNKTFSSIVATDQTGAALIDTTNNIVYINGAEGLATAFGCTSGLSRPIGTTNCEPSSLVPAGTTLSVGTSTGAGTNGGAPPFGAPTGSSANGTGPYPFWQWVPGAQGAGSRPSNATVYSDNHGEAVVALQTNVSTQVAPTNGVCPSGYTPVTSGTGGAVINCLLPFTALATSGAPGNGPFANIASATSQFSASKPGCLNTFSTGTTSVATTATIGANGPSAGQICINNLGGIEFGSQATLGQTTIQAVADYPYTRGEHAPVGSAPLTKVFTSGFSKSVTVSAGTAGPVGTTAYTVTVTALDLCGTPLNGEPIQVYALGNAGAAVLAPVSYGTLISAGTTSAVVTPNVLSGTATFSLEVLNTAIGNQGLIVKVVFPLESVERFATVISGTVTGVTTTVVYPPGWQQVGGPSGSNFSVAEALFSWDPTASAYTNASAAAGNISSAPPACTGYWAYFAAAMSISFTVTSHPGDVATCTLKSGWNLVGNPFGSAATIQSGVTAFHWNGTSYDTVGVIGVGQSVWIFNSGTLNTVTLTAT